MVIIIPWKKKVNTPVKMIKPKSVRQGQYYKTKVQQYLILAHLTVTYSTKKKNYKIKNLRNNYEGLINDWLDREIIRMRQTVTAKC